MAKQASTSDLQLESAICDVRMKTRGSDGGQLRLQKVEYEDCVEAVPRLRTILPSSGAAVALRTSRLMTDTSIEDSEIRHRVRLYPLYEAYVSKR
jgi:hypothetical protein